MLSNLKLQTKILICFSILVIAIVTIFCIFSNYYIFTSIENRITDNLQQLTIKISQQVDAYIEEIDQVSKNFIINKELLNTLTVINNNDTPINIQQNLNYDRILDELTSNLIILTPIQTSHIYINNKDNTYKYSYNPTKSNLELIASNIDYIKMLANRDLIIYPDNQNSKKYNGSDSFSLIRSVFDIDGNKYGYVEVQQDYSILNTICNIGNTGQIFIIDKQKNIFYPDNIIDTATKNMLINKKLNGENGIFRDKSGDIYSFNNSLYTDFTIFIKYSNKTVFAPLYFVQTVTYLIIIVITLVSFVMIYLLSKFLVHPIRKLRDNIVNINYKNMELNFSEKIYNDEVNLLNITFQDMLDRLKLSIERELQTSKEEAKARYTALQAQIAPHFIHNVLYIISISAQENRTNDVVSMCKQLSNMLRYVVDSPFSIVTLEEEINYTLSYMSLLKNKYEDFLFTSIDLQKEAKGIVLPRLVIQPFVENAINHGFEGRKPPWRISISCKITQGQWSIIIEDNGCGIKENKLKEIYHKISSINVDRLTSTIKDGKGMCSMGVVNTVMRLKLMYKDQLDFQIYNSDKSGTIVLITGPQDINSADDEK